MDFSKAFDRVPHKRLLQKLKKYQFSNEIISWIEAWLAMRRQQVTVNGKNSEWREVKSSVVQGSVLGPLLFVLYIDDIDDCLKKREGIAPKFADDTKIAKVVKDQQTATEMQSVIHELESWCKKWAMHFNVKK